MNAETELSCYMSRSCRKRNARKKNEATSGRYPAGSCEGISFEMMRKESRQFKIRENGKERERAG